MALSGTVLGDLIMANIDAAVAAHHESNPTQRQAIFRAMGEAIVAHILTAQVIVTVTSVSGVTTGIGVSGPGAGTGTLV